QEWSPLLAVLFGVEFFYRRDGHLPAQVGYDLALLVDPERPFSTEILPVAHRAVQAVVKEVGHRLQDPVVGVGDGVIARVAEELVDWDPGDIHYAPPPSPACSPPMASFTSLMCLQSVPLYCLRIT